MDGRIGIMKLTVAIRNFANTPKKLYEMFLYMQSTELVFVASSRNNNASNL
jgi:hypothetical protein